MIKLQECPKSDRSELCVEIEKKLDRLFNKGWDQTAAALTVIIPVNGQDHNLYTFMSVAKDHLQYFKNA